MESGVAPGGGGLSSHLPFGWFQAGKMEHTHLKDINCLQVMILV